MENCESPFTSVVYMTQKIWLILIYGVCINISGGGSRGRVCHHMTTLSSVLLLNLFTVLLMRLCKTSPQCESYSVELIFAQ